MNHGDAAPLAAGGIIPASFLSRGACIISKKKKKHYYYNHFFVSWRLCLGDVNSCLLLRFFLGPPEVNYCPIWTSQVAKFIYSP